MFFVREKAKIPSRDNSCILYIKIQVAKINRIW